MKKIIALILAIMMVFSMNILVIGTSAARGDREEVTPTPTPTPIPTPDPSYPASATLPDGTVITAGSDMTDVEAAPEGAVAITTAAEFAEIAGDGIYYIAADDIQIDATNTNVFSGTLYGCGKTIKATKSLFANLEGTVQDLTVAVVIEVTAADKVPAVADDESTTEVNEAAEEYLNAGAVAAKAYNGAVVKNVYVSGSIVAGTEAAPISVDNMSIGGVVGYLNNATVINCTNKVDLSSYWLYSSGSSLDSHLGGIVGLVDGVSLIESCVNYGSLSNVRSAAGVNVLGGGIAGQVTGRNSKVEASAIVINNCINSGSVLATSASGGIVGKYYSDSDTENELTNCVNTGDIDGNHAAGVVGYIQGFVTIDNCAVTTDATITAADGNCGGIVAFLGAIGVNEIKNCVNEGATLVQNSVNPIGGILGIFSATKNSAKTFSIKMTNCVNYSDIISAQGNYIGGIAGRVLNGDNASTTPGDVDFIDCINYGDVGGDTPRSGSYPGGMVGILRVIGKVTFTGCENHGEINGNKAYTGGILGYSVSGAEKVSMISCVNTGDIYTITEATNSTAGGLLGYQVAGLTVIEDGVNTGDVVSAGRAAGIVGWAGGASTITDCVNTGYIASTNTTTAHAYVAGIIAYPAQAGTITGCANFGEVFSTMSAGGIVGLANNASTVVKYCLNAGTINGDETYGVATRSTGARIAIGGIVGATSKKVTVYGCLNVGEVLNTNSLTATTVGAGTYAGGILGAAQADSTVDNCFVKANTVTAGGAATAYNIAPSSYEYDNKGTNVTVTITITNSRDNVTVAELANGTLAYTLKSLSDEEANVWGQEINIDEHPIPGSIEVKKATEAEVYYNEMFEGAISLAASLALNARANVYNPAGAELTMKFTLLDNSTVVPANASLDAFYLLGRFDGIAPQAIAETIAVDLCLGDEVLFSDTLCIVDYLEDVATVGEKEADVAKALLRYGYEARAYLIAKGVATEGDLAAIESDLLDTSALAPVDVEDMVYTKNDSYTGGVAIHSVGVRFDGVNSLYFKVVIPEEADASLVTLMYNGEVILLEKTSDGMYTGYTDGIFALDFGSAGTATLSVGADNVAELSYNIYNYAERMQNNETIGDLAAATYYYGVAAMAYSNSLK